MPKKDQSEEIRELRSLLLDQNMVVQELMDAVFGQLDSIILLRQRIEVLERFDCHKVYLRGASNGRKN